MNKPTILKIYVGLPETLGTEGAVDPMDRPWTSGYFKSTVDGPVWLGKTNLEGDGQADLKDHGGPDKAVCVYPSEHYPTWNQEINVEGLAFGGFGENFTVQGLMEEDVCVGDTFQIGEAIVQITQPRQSCWKMARRWKNKELPARFLQTGRTGWYMRVLKEGYVQSGNEIVLMERPYPEWTIPEVNDLMHFRKDDLKASTMLADCTLLSDRWLKRLNIRLEKAKT